MFYVQFASQRVNIIQCLIEDVFSYSFFFFITNDSESPLDNADGKAKNRGRIYIKDEIGRSI